MEKKKAKLSLEKRHNLTGWAFLLPASILIFVFCFYPMSQAILLSFRKTGGVFNGVANYARIFKDKTFQQCLFNTFFYFVIQVPIMLVLALMLAQLLNNPKIKGKGIFRTLIFLPCATSLVSYSMIFKSLFAPDGVVNRVLMAIGLSSVDWFQSTWPARWVIVIALIWRWTGYNMVFYLAGLQNIEYSVYEAAKIDGCSYYQIFMKIILPLLKPALTSACIFSFMWRWDDFLGALLYVNKTEKYPVSLALKMFCDPSSSSDYGAMFAMATLSILPAVLIFFCLQRYLVEGISTSGLKG